MDNIKDKKDLSLILVIIILLALLSMSRSCQKKESQKNSSETISELDSMPNEISDQFTKDTVSDSVISPPTIPETTFTAKDTVVKPEIEETTLVDDGHYKLQFADKPFQEFIVIDSLDVIADPWGGRHFDSVTVSLKCQQKCEIVYSLHSEKNLKPYESPISIHKNTTLWFSGVNEKGQQTKPIKLEYVIEKNPRTCLKNMLPVKSKSHSFCMDVYEWPNIEGGMPKTSVTHKEAVQLCESQGKRLCTVEEWTGACSGLKNHLYPYGNKYHENYCPSKEKTFSRSGRFPTCRSFFGIYDMTGNLWEWTKTPSKNKQGFYMAAGGTWDSGDKGTCNETKYSFYPQNKYLFLGFRCCLKRVTN